MNQNISQMQQELDQITAQNNQLSQENYTQEVEQNDTLAYIQSIDSQVATVEQTIA